MVHTENGAPAVADPAIRKQFVELSPPERGDDAADLIRLEKIVGPIDADLDVLRLLPGWLRENHFRGTAVASEGNLIDFEPGNTESECFAVAVDVGTTTLAAMLLDLNTGAERAVVSRLNPQTTFGEDVLARIRHARENAGGLHELHERIVEAIDAMVGELAAEAGVGRERIYELVVAGNTTMQQMLCRIDPSSFGESPFAPTTTRRVDVAASKLGLQLHPRARVYVLPSIGGFVGGDIVAGILATGLADGPGPTLLVDIGTNGEIVLFADGKLTAASTAAGPAFEGARISQGMRGCAGAIEKGGARRASADQRDRQRRAGGLCAAPPWSIWPPSCSATAFWELTAAFRVGDELSGDMTPDLRRPRGRPRRPAGVPSGDRGGDWHRPADSGYPARFPRATTGHRGNPRRRGHSSASGGIAAGGPGPRLNRRARSATSSGGATRSGWAFCRTKFPETVSVFRATRRWLAPGWRPYPKPPAAKPNGLPPGPDTSICPTISSFRKPLPRPWFFPTET